MSVNGLPAARVGDKTAHGGIITSGSPNVDIGGPSFSIPSVFVLEGDAAFQQKLIRDLYFLSTLPSGQELFRRLEAAGETIKFVPTSDENGYCSPNNGLFSTLGISTGSEISYNPDYHAVVEDSSNNMITDPPQVILAHEMAHALANSEGTHRLGTDPNPPATQPDIEEEEAQAIGTGSHSQMYPSENSVRDDLGLPRRDNHYGYDPPNPPPQINLRPGGP